MKKHISIALGLSLFALGCNNPVGGFFGPSATPTSTPSTNFFLHRPGKVTYLGHKNGMSLYQVEPDEPNKEEETEPKPVTRPPTIHEAAPEEEESYHPSYHPSYHYTPHFSPHE